MLKKFGPLMAPKEDRGDDLPGDDDELKDADRGNDFTPTDDDDPNKDDKDAGKGGKKEDDLDDADDSAKGKDALRAKVEEDAKKADDDAKKADDAKKTEDEAKGKKGAIPLERHEKVLQRERERREAAEAELKKYQGASRIADTNKAITEREDKVSKLDEDYAKALADGDTKKASELMRDIRKLDREIGDLKTDARVAAAEVRAVETARYDITLERIEAAYPELNPDSEKFDKDIAEDVVDLMDVYQKRGDPPSRALQKAVTRLLGADTSKQEHATQVTPRVDKDDVKDEDEKKKGAEKLAADRKADAVNKAADANKRQPPATDKVGQNSDKAGGGLNARDVSKMSYDDFVKLPDEDLARVRGDVI